MLVSAISTLNIKISSLIWYDLIVHQPWLRWSQWWHVYIYHIHMIWPKYCFTTCACLFSFTFSLLAKSPASKKKIPLLIPQTNTDLGLQATKTLTQNASKHIIWTTPSTVALKAAPLGYHSTKTSARTEKLIARSSSWRSGSMVTIFIISLGLYYILKMKEK